MDVDKKCKNLLIEQICYKCNNKEEDVCVCETKTFPYVIPKLYKLLLLEQKFNNDIIPITAYTKENKIYIKAEDYNKDSIYLIHFRYPMCTYINKIIPLEFTCEQFIPIK